MASPLKDHRPRLRIGCGLAALGLVLFTAAGWGLYRVPAVNWRAQVLQAEVRDFLFPHPDTLPTPVLVAQAPPAAEVSATLPSPTAAPTQRTLTSSPTIALSPTIAPSPTAARPPQVALIGFSHQFQTWNNCGPATLTTALSYYGRPERQAEAAAFLKPDGNDKNVSPDEMAAYVHQVGLEATVRVGGTLEDLKRLIANGFPVVVEKGFEPDADKGWMGHYLLLTGYDDARGVFITQDSYLGPNLPATYAEVDRHWRQFNRLFIVPYPADEAERLESLIGPEDPLAMYEEALPTAQAEASADSGDAFAWFNVGTNLTALNRYEEAAVAYDQARLAGLPWRMLWYQFGPYQAYYRIGRYDDVLVLSDATLGASDNLEESHYWRGMALVQLGQVDEARREFEVALAYNPNFELARAALNET